MTRNETRFPPSLSGVHAATRKARHKSSAAVSGSEGTVVREATDSTARGCAVAAVRSPPLPIAG